MKNLIVLISFCFFVQVLAQEPDLTFNAKDRTWGYKSKDGKVLDGFRSAKPFFKGYAVADNKILDTSLKVLIEGTVTDQNRSCILIHKDKRTFIFSRDLKGIIFKTTHFTSAKFFYENVIVSTSKKESGLISSKGRVLIKLSPGYLHRFGFENNNQGRFLTRRDPKTNRQSIYNSLGKLVAEGANFYPKALSPTYSISGNKGTLLYDRGFKLLVPEKYQLGYPHKDLKLFKVLSKGKTGLLNSEGKFLIPITDKLNIHNQMDGLVVVEDKKTQKRFIYSHTGKKYKAVGRAAVMMGMGDYGLYADGKDGYYLYKEGKQVSKKKYRRFRAINKILVECYDDKNKIDLYTTKGALLEEDISGVSTMQGGYFLIKKGDKKGLVDPNGNLLIKPICDEFYAWGDLSDYEVFSWGVLRFSYKGKMGLLTSSGKIAVKPAYNSIYRLNNGCFVLEGSGYQTLISADLKLLFARSSCYYKESFNDKYILFSINKAGKELEGVVNTKGEVIVQPLFSNLSTFKDYVKLHVHLNKELVPFKAKEHQALMTEVQFHFNDAATYKNGNIYSYEHKSRGRTDYEQATGISPVIRGVYYTTYLDERKRPHHKIHAGVKEFATLNVRTESNGVSKYTSENGTYNYIDGNGDAIAQAGSNYQVEGDVEFYSMKLGGNSNYGKVLLRYRGKELPSAHTYVGKMGDFYIFSHGRKVVISKGDKNFVVDGIYEAHIHHGNYLILLGEKPGIFGKNGKWIIKPALNNVIYNVSNTIYDDGKSLYRLSHDGSIFPVERIVYRVSLPKLSRKNLVHNKTQVKPPFLK